MSFTNFEYEYIEFYVENAKKAADWHIQSLGFDIEAHSGPMTGDETKVSYYLKKNNVKIVVTSPYKSSPHELINFVNCHGYGVKRVAYRVEDVDTFFERIVSGGAIPIKKPDSLEDGFGRVSWASFKLFDDNEIVLINRSNYSGVFMPGYEPFQKNSNISPDSCLESIDHITYALHENESSLWLSYLNNIFSSTVTQEFGRGKIGSSNSGLTLKILKAVSNRVTNVLVEPDNQIGISQIQEFLDSFNGSGVQHIAFATTDIVCAARHLTDAGIEVATYPTSYYDSLKKKLLKNNISLDVDSLQKYGILCDLRHDSYLLQCFTKPISRFPTFFYEIIQRVGGYSGFGEGNISDLFRAVEIGQRERTSESALTS